jgi:alpha-aminoadipic semialdehyde synthase
VSELLRANPSFSVLVQPSNKRIFRDSEYKAVGATITDDLSPACLVLGVKQVDADTLHRDKSYMFFSHVIKGQPENMPLLQAILDNNIRLLDYECITQGGLKGKERLVAFGKFAGVAGMINIFQAVGQQLLQSGYSTPFLNSPSSYMYRDLIAARFGISSMGRDIESGGLPATLEPLVFAFTGTNPDGKVCSGAREVFELLPHKYVDVKDLPALKKMKGPHNCVYGVLVSQEHMTTKKDGSSPEVWSEQDVMEYRNNPDLYKPVFHETVAPYVNVLINGMYWDQRYPRLLTKAQIKDLYDKGNNSLLALADISCDIGGSVEFMSKSTSIEKPYYHYDPLTDSTTDEVMKEGIAILAVDILPSELPRESSKHFGDALVGLLPSVLDPSSEGIAPELEGATIARNGDLVDSFKYIDQLKKDVLMGAKGHVNQKSPKRKEFEAATKLADDKSLMLVLDGHLFDSGLLTNIMDLFEANNCGVEINNIDVGGKTIDGFNRPTHAVLRVFCLNPQGDLSALKSVADKAANLVEVMPAAAASVRVIEPVSEGTVTSVTSEEQKNILLLGSGRVANPFSDYLGANNDGRKIVVAGAVADEVASVRSEAKHSEGHVFDLGAESERGRLNDLVSKADVVVSLLPAPLHPMVGELCINNQKNMVTASYVSPGIKALHDRAVEAGICILNEVGLDPGMDHMSAMRIMDDVRERGGSIKSFSSVCGGLPAPEAANNPLMYKFSWSPMGVLTASSNNARYLKGGEVVEIDGSELLNNANDIFSFPTMNLECLANRDSLGYREIYGIESAEDVFRGTLRFKGFSEIMYGVKKLGLMDDVVDDSATWAEVVADLLKAKGCANLKEFYVKECGGTEAAGIKLEACLQWLDMMDASGASKASGESRIKSLCDLLENRLTFGDHERDMVLMAHDFKAEFPDGRLEHHVSTMQLYGDDRYTAMGKTVGVTCAIGTEMVLDGWIKEKGVLTPMTKNIYEKGLELLEEQGLIFDESCTVSYKK